MFLYTRVKGEIERDIGKLNIEAFSVFRPGLLLARDNDERCLEKLMACCKCCIPHIEAELLARSIIVEAGLVSN